MVISVMTALCGVFCLSIWVPAQSYAVLLIFAFASGSVTGIFWGTVVPVMAEVVGMQRLPSAFGMMCLPLIFPTVFAEPIALELATAAGYLTAKVFVGCMFLFGALSMFALRSWKICDLEKKEMQELERSDSAFVGSECPDSQQKESWLTPRRLFKNRRV